MEFMLIAGLVLITIGFIIGIANMVSGFARMDGDLGSTFTRHGIVMVIMFIGMVLVFIGGGSIVWDFIRARL